MKVLAQYLPQFHECVENNSWWGKGFTEWNLVKTAKPLWPGHQQPQVPSNKHYYDLSNVAEMERQFRFAREHDIHGFNVYFYWSCSKRLLETPISNILRNKKIDFSYCLTWANHPWTRTWTNRKGAAEILFDQNYETTKLDFDLFSKELILHFQDDRYIKQNGLPIFCIYKISDLPTGFITNLRQALKVYGFEIFLVGMLKDFDDLNFANDFDSLVPFNPSFALHARKDMKTIKDYTKYFRKQIIKYVPKFGDNILNLLALNNTKKISYKYFSDRLIDTYKDLVNKTDHKILPMACCGFDNTPRYGRRATILTDYSDDIFEEQVRRLKDTSLNSGTTELFFINAWNEWGEGMYLESDEQKKFDKILAFKKGIHRGTIY